MVKKKSSIPIATTAKRSSARERTAEMVTILREEITNGARPIGSFLPSLVELSEQYQLSKNTVRKGLDLLVGEGLIETVPRIGAQVIAKQNSEMITLRFAYYATLVNEAKIFELVEQFERLHPHIEVIPVRLPDNPKDSTAVMEDLMPSLDLLTINLLDYGSLSDHEQLFEPVETRPEMYSFLNEPFIKEEVQYVQPFLFSPIILCYNKEHFREKQLPEPNSGWTWEDIKNCGRALHDTSNRYGLFFHVPSENRWPLFLLQNNFSFDADNPNLSLSDPEFKQSMNEYNNLIQDKTLFPPYFSENDEEVESVFLSGNVSMVIISYMRLNSFLNAPFEYDISPIPFFNQPKTMLVIIGLAVSKYSANKQAAKELMDFLTSYETQLSIRQQTLSIPAFAAAAEWNGEEQLKNRPSRYLMYREIIPSFKTYQDMNVKVPTLFAISSELKYFWAKMNDLDTVIERLEQKLAGENNKTLEVLKR